MQFELFERKFKILDGELYSYHQRGKNQIEKWHLITLTLGNHGYNTFGVQIKGKRKCFLYHRVVYYSHNPQWNLFDNSKENVIDHVDQNKSNNHISNLRNITNQENGFNRRCKGYYFHKKSGKYVAQIKLNNKSLHIGLFDTEDEAHQAYLNKKKELHKIQAR